MYYLCVLVVCTNCKYKLYMLVVFARGMNYLLVVGTCFIYWQYVIVVCISCMY